MKIIAEFPIHQKAFGNSQTDEDTYRTIQFINLISFQNFKIVFQLITPYKIEDSIRSYSSYYSPLKVNGKN